tara:strand:- start:198153 stop:199172 length:1020 start_codon:yes stop_codon:yes gene_type:complete
MNINKFNKEIQKYLHKKDGNCMFNSHCNNELQKCHSIQNGFILKRLKDENNNVYFLHEKDDKFQLNLTNVRSATTFYGYCNYHDSKIFSIIDFKNAKDLSSLSNNHYFTFFFRELSNEMYKKKRSKKLFKILSEAVKNEDKSEIKSVFKFYNNPENKITFNIESYEYLNGLYEGTSKALLQLDKIFNNSLNQLKNQRIPKMLHFKYILDKEVSFSVSSLISPSFYYKNVEFNNHPDYPFQYSCLVIFPIKNKTLILLISPIEFWQQFLYFRQFFFKESKEKLEILLSKKILENIENIVISPKINNSNSIAKKLSEIMFKSNLNPYELISDNEVINLFDL